MLTENAPLVVEDLRFALDVMQDRSHLGLDSEFASKLQSLMLKKIARAEKAINSRPSLTLQIKRPGEGKTA